MTSVAEMTQTVAAGYCGWSNYETWLVSLWFNNEECYYHELRDILREYETVEEQAEELEQACRFIVERHDDTGLRTDLINAVLIRVNWREIAKNNTEVTL